MDCAGGQRIANVLWIYVDFKHKKCALVLNCELLNKIPRASVTPTPTSSFLLSNYITLVNPQAQQENHELFRSWIDQEVAPLMCP